MLEAVHEYSVPFRKIKSEYKEYLVDQADLIKQT